MNNETAFGQYVDLLRDNFAMLGNRPEWLRHINAGAADALSRHVAAYRSDTELPEQLRDDVLFAPDYGINMGHIAMGADVAASFRCGVPQLGSHTIVVANDFACTPASVPDGVVLTSLAELPAQYQSEAMAMLKTPAMPSIAGEICNAFTHDGVYLRIEPGTVVDKAVQIVNIFNSSEPMLTPRHLLVHACAGSKVRILLCDHSQSDAAHLNLQTVNIIVDENAEVEYYDIEEASAATHRIFGLAASQADHSSLSVNTFILSGGTSRNEYHIDVDGHHARTLMGGLAIESGAQTCSTNVTLNHRGTHCTSRQLFKTALFDKSRGLFGGRIVVSHGAVHTDAAQTNRNIIESDAARMTASPQLEIYCDDVKCSHGATTGQLDERALFYMQSRGIDREQARSMLTQAFMVDVIDNISFEVLRQRMHVLVEKRLSGSSADCTTCATACKS